MADESSKLKEIIEKIKEITPLTKYFAQYTLMQWAKLIHEGKYDDYQNPPPDLDNIDIQIGDPEDTSSCPETSDEYSDDSPENEYGDVVIVKGNPFIVCNGLVVPKDLLEKSILPLIEGKMNELGITVDEVHEALLDQSYSH